MHTIREAWALPCAACCSEGPMTTVELSDPVVGVVGANLTKTEQEIFIPRNSSFQRLPSYCLPSPNHASLRHPYVLTCVCRLGDSGADVVIEA